MTAGRSEEFRFTIGQCSLGPVLLASSDRGVVAILFGENPKQLVDELQRRFPKSELVQGTQLEEKWMRRLVRHIERPSRQLDLPLDIRGTDFQKRVWRVVQRIPVGQTMTYGEVAKKIGSPRAMRAVGNACSAVNLAIAIPCHRVTRNDSSTRSRQESQSDRRHELLKRESSVGAK